MSDKKIYYLPVEPADPNAEYMTIQETAWVLKCSVGWLRKGINRGGFPHSTRGRRIVFDRADRAAIHDMHRAEPKPVKRVRPVRPRKTAAKPPVPSAA